MKSGEDNNNNVAPAGSNGEPASHPASVLVLRQLNANGNNNIIIIILAHGRTFS